MTKTTEDTLTESAFTKMTSYVLGPNIIISFYGRYASTDAWEFADDYRITLEEFEYIQETFEYLVIKYNYEIKHDKHNG